MTSKETRINIVSLARSPAASTRPTGTVQKLAPELRKPKISFDSKSIWYSRFLRRLKNDSQFLRSSVQLVFALLCVWIGIEFYLFMQWGMSGGQTAFVSRPPGAEGFLPIGALISLKYWLQTGIISNIHPSGLFILIAIVTLSVVVKKAFCSWLCPVGTLSEALWMLGKKLLKRDFNTPRWLDYPLRSLKYLILFFFANSIWQMDVPALENFINSPYNKVADIKMYSFFANISMFALGTIVVLMVLTIFVKNFWCRFLCPYGALLGMMSWLSPLKITRNKETCIECELCTKACPSNIKVHKSGRVWSDECMSCMLCVEACPAKNTLDVRVRAKSRNAVPQWVVGTLVAGLFVAITGMAILTGNWQNGISKEEYRYRMKNLDSPVYHHNRGSVPRYGPKD